jgi:hypothetical protein
MTDDEAEEWDEEEVPLGEAININVVPEFLGTRRIAGGCCGVSERDRVVNRIRQLVGSRCSKPGRKMLCSMHSEQWLRYMTEEERVIFARIFATAPADGIQPSLLVEAYTCIANGKLAESRRIEMEEIEAIRQAEAERIQREGRRIAESRRQIEQIGASGALSKAYCCVISKLVLIFLSLCAGIHRAWSNTTSAPLPLQPITRIRPRSPPRIELEEGNTFRHELGNLRRRVEQLESKVTLHKEWREAAKNLYVRMVTWISPRASRVEAVQLAEEMGALNVLDAQALAQQRVDELTAAIEKGMILN